MSAWHPAGCDCGICTQARAAVETPSSSGAEGWDYGMGLPPNGLAIAVMSLGWLIPAIAGLLCGVALMIAVALFTGDGVHCGHSLSGARVCWWSR